MTWLGRFIHGRDMRSPLRDGFLGIGGNGPDKQKEAASQGNLNNVFSYGLGTGEQGQATGQQDLSAATDYWRKQLTAGRSDVAQNSAPAVQAVVNQSDATRKQEGQFGTGRTGGTVAANRDADTAKNANIDNIINQNLVGGKQAAATGLESVGSTQLQNAMAALGLGTQAETSVLNSSQADRADVMQAQAQIWGDIIKGLL